MELLIFLTIPIFKAWHDHKYGNLNHLASGAAILGVIGVFGYAMSLMFTHEWYTYIICGLAIQWAIFDDLYNIWHGNKFGYIGEAKYHKDDIFYKLYDHLPWAAIEFAKGWLLMVGYGFYFHLDWIL